MAKFLEQAYSRIKSFVTLDNKTSWRQFCEPALNCIWVKFVKAEFFGEPRRIFSWVEFDQVSTVGFGSVGLRAPGKIHRRKLEKIKIPEYFNTRDFGFLL
eukprot:Gregarina_sp_Poly_1__5174@NODE_2741_length_1766_cov_9_911713_g1735_i0_p1_GENE_NODE_2741_length_1766_cov_9_911713_g1735_i0NODE_2741_length_1766_cov_9_911713_g1735_i0_p1_ORF_typecomplete_len100_score10_20_NODE_2741_length_1766_cov_9_911713_g1735_i0221520